MSSNIEESHPDPDTEHTARFDEIMKRGYFIVNYDGNEQVPGFIRCGHTFKCTRPDVFVRYYSFWEQNKLPPGANNPWDVNPDGPEPENPNLEAEYIKEHSYEMVYFVYRVEGGKFTEEYVLNSPECDGSELGELARKVTVPLTINGNPAKFTFIAYYNVDMLSPEIEFVFDERTFDHVGFPEDAVVDIYFMGEYEDKGNTWRLYVS